MPQPESPREVVSREVEEEEQDQAVLELAYHVLLLIEAQLALYSL
jgi:hypothetical protein